MGTWFQFSCSRCGYQAEVSGGSDAGMVAVTATILCRRCRRLFDVVAGKVSISGQIKKVPLRCPRSASHPIERWSHPGPCPRCGTTLTREGETALWD